MIKLTLPTLALALCCGFAGSVGAMDKDAHKAAQTRIEAEYRGAKAKCESMKGHARNICKDDAKGRHQLAKAELKRESKTRS